jgi:Tfp pilus assembly protein PilN
MSISLGDRSGAPPALNAGGSSFLPSEYVSGKNEHRANVMALVLLGVVTCGTVAAFAVTNRRWESIRDEHRMIAAHFKEEEQKIEQLKELERQRLEMVEKAEVVNALVDRVPRSVLMAELTRDLPAGMLLTGVQLDGKRVVTAPPPPDPAKSGGSGRRSLRDKGKKAEEPAEPARVPPPVFEHTVTVDGRARLNNDVADYFGRLRGSPLFSSAELVSIEQSRGGDGMERTFRLRLQIAPNADARQVAGTAETTLVEESRASAAPDGTEG